jgi:hypothetical protein
MSVSDRKLVKGEAAGMLSVKAGSVFPFLASWNLSGQPPEATRYGCNGGAFTGSLGAMAGSFNGGLRMVQLRV